MTRILACSLFCITFLASQAAQAKDFGKIMPMGDSITLGVGDEGGYRDPLYTLLTNGGHTFTFVGSDTGNSTELLSGASQTHHEGHSGYIINGTGSGASRPGLDENINTWIGKDGVSPDIILLMIGTNDMGTGYDVAGAPDRLRSLISNIYSKQANVSLYVATLTPFPSVEDAVHTFNAAVPGIVSKFKTDGKDIHFVNMHDALTASDLPDGLHPGSAGYDKMAQAWYNALVVPEPSCVVMVFTGLIALSGYAWRKRK